MGYQAYDGVLCFCPFLHKTETAIPRRACHPLAAAALPGNLPQMQTPRSPTQSWTSEHRAQGTGVTGPQCSLFVQAGT